MLFRSIWLAVITGVGGGTVRDLILDVPVFWVQSPVYVAACLVTAVVMHFVAPLVESRYKTLRWFDAFGLALVTVAGTVKSLDGKGAVINLGGDIEGYLRASELSRDRIEDMRTHLKENDSVNAMIINIDRKNRSINLSIKAKDNAEEGEAMQRISAENSSVNTGTTNLGALLKAKLDPKNTN